MPKLLLLSLRTNVRRPNVRSLGRDNLIVQPNYLRENRPSTLGPSNCPAMPAWRCKLLAFASNWHAGIPARGNPPATPPKFKLTATGPTPCRRPRACPGAPDSIHGACIKALKHNASHLGGTVFRTERTRPPFTDAITCGLLISAAHHLHRSPSMAPAIPQSPSQTHKNDAAFATAPRHIIPPPALRAHPGAPSPKAYSFRRFGARARSGPR